MQRKTRGLRWPVVDGKETLWRFREGYDPYVAKNNPGGAKGDVYFYGNHKKNGGKAKIISAPYSIDDLQVLESNYIQTLDEIGRTGATVSLQIGLAEEFTTTAP